MRKVFTSQRLENVEGVAQLLRDEDIEVRITNGRSYKGNRRSRFSYRESTQPEGPQPAVWVIKSEDQPRARALLRDAGLLASTRVPGDSYQGAAQREDAAGKPGPSPEKRAMRIKLALLAGIALIVLLQLLR